MIDAKTKRITIIHRHLPGCKVILFGSRARGTHVDGTDYDIAIDVGRKIPFTTMLKTWGDVVKIATSPSTLTWLMYMLLPLHFLKRYK